MPLYEFECEGCDERFEALVRMSQKDDPKSCPQCGSEQTTRVPSTFTVGAAPRSTTDCTTCCPGSTCGL